MRSKRLSAVQLREEIGRIAVAQQLMRDANSALGRDDMDGLIQLGFSPEHIADLKRPRACGTVGFPDYALKNNEMTLRALERKLAAVANRHNRAESRASELPPAYDVSLVST